MPTQRSFSSQGRKRGDGRLSGRRCSVAGAHGMTSRIWLDRHDAEPERKHDHAGVRFDANRLWDKRRYPREGYNNPPPGLMTSR